MNTCLLSKSPDATMEWIKVCRLADIPRPGARVVKTLNGDIAVFRTLDDQVFALHDKCPHRGGPLSQGIVHGHKVACPLHGWNIELDSGEAAAPDKGCALRYPARLEDEMVYLSLHVDDAGQLHS